MRRLGILVTRWSIVEQYIADLFASLTDSNPGLMMVVTVNVSQNTLISWMRTLIELRPMDDATRHTLENILTDVDNLRAERNNLVHGVWRVGHDPLSAIVNTAKLERRDIIQEPLVTPHDLDDIIGRVDEVRARLLAVLGK